MIDLYESRIPTETESPMKMFLTAGLLLISTSSIAIAAEQPTVTATVSSSLEETVRTDTAAALTAIEEGDYRSAAFHLQAAGDTANRLSLKNLAQKIQIATPTFQTENTQFALASSSTIEIENLLKNSDTLERSFKDGSGNIVTVRLFNNDNDLDSFKTVAVDEKMLEKSNIETVEMMGEVALKREINEGDGLSVLTMSEKDHALIEIEGENKEAVMAFIEDLENGE